MNEVFPVPGGPCNRKPSFWGYCRQQQRMGHEGVTLWCLCAATAVKTSTCLNQTICWEQELGSRATVCTVNTIISSHQTGQSSARMHQPDAHPRDGELARLVRERIHQLQDHRLIRVEERRKGAVLPQLIPPVSRPRPTPCPPATFPIRPCCSLGLSTQHRHVQVAGAVDARAQAGIVGGHCITEERIHQAGTVAAGTLQGEDDGLVAGALRLALPLPWLLHCAAQLNVLRHLAHCTHKCRRG